MTLNYIFELQEFPDPQEPWKYCSGVFFIKICVESSSENSVFSNKVITQVTYGKGLLINMKKLVLGPYLPDFTS